MPAYNFVTTWRIAAPLPEVWEALICAPCWLKWWPGLLSVEELEKGEASGVGRLQRFIWQGALPYRLCFEIKITAVEPRRTISGQASGDLSGSGVWRFSQTEGATLVRYEWSVRTARWWLSVLARLAGPLVVWNHDRVMDWGGAGLAGYLAASRS